LHGLEVYFILTKQNRIVVESGLTGQHSAT